jgi:hypothetical protein
LFENLKGRDLSENLGVNGKVGMHMAQDRDQWHALVNTVISPRIL